MLKALKVRNSKLRGDQGGFTIVELIIVIAIAALILVIALAVVPALRRSGRNSARNSDIRATSAQLLEYASQNGGKIPVDNTTFQAAVSGNVDLVHADWAATDMTFIPAPSAGYVAATATVSLAIADVDINKARFYGGAKCRQDSILQSGTASAPTATNIFTTGAGGASTDLIEDGVATAVAVVYFLEGSEDSGRQVISCLEV